MVREMLAQVTWSRIRSRLFHYRSQGGQKVDLLLEDVAGRIVGIEVKASASVNGPAFRSLRTLRTLLGDRFVRGIVFYTGHEVVPIGDRLHAVPMSWPWRGPS